MRKILILLSTCLCSFFVNAQVNRPNVKFGTVKEADFATNVYSIDSNAQAVVLYDFGEVSYEGNNAGYFNVVYKYHKRVRLLNKNSFDLATIEIPLYKRGNEEDKLEKLQAVTYNLIDGKVAATKIDKSSVFKDKVNKTATIQKFTFPDVKEGCIIEYLYTLSSPTPSNIRSWYFQENNPVLWSEYIIHVPSIYEFLFLKQGYHPFIVDSTGNSQESYTLLIPGDNIMDRAETYRGNLLTYHKKWVLQDIPALKRENFTSSLSNHIAKISFQFSSFTPPGGVIRPALSTWFETSRNLLKSEYFGAEIDTKSGWLRDEVKIVIGNEKNELEQAKKIHAHLRDNFICTNYDDYSMDQPLKKIFQAKKGNVAEINLLMIAMFKCAGLNAKPVLLSTRDNGKPLIAYPILSKFNYTICQLFIGEENFLVDASQPLLGFGKLVEDCYNDYGRVIDEQSPIIINLSADSVKESKLTSVTIINHEKDGMLGTVNAQLGYFESLSTRKKLQKEKLSDFFLELKKSFGFDIEMTNTNIDSLKTYEEPIGINYDIKFNMDEDLIYFNPMLTEGYKQNPFKAAKRYYPVEMPYTFIETYILNMEVPKGYTIDELPKSVRIKLNDNEGMFEYIIAKVGDGIQLRSILKINKANFNLDDYDTLRDFYALLVKKHSEQIVFKKVKK
jgi:hypothetical protein